MGCCHACSASGDSAGRGTGLGQGRAAQVAQQGQWSHDESGQGEYGAFSVVAKVSRDCRVAAERAASHDDLRLFVDLAHAVPSSSARFRCAQHSGSDCSRHL